MSDDSKVIQLYPDENGVFHEYNDEWDITIHCESQEENAKVIAMLNEGPKAYEFLREKNLTVEYNKWKRERGYEC